MGGFRYLMIQLCVDSFEAAIGAWVAELMSDLPEQEDGQLEAVAIDGKSLCGSMTQHTRAVHLLAALDQRTGFVLSQKAVSSKTNEHKAAWPLLRELVLEGRVITGDAMFCHRDLCKKITDRKGHYLFQVKKNQANLLSDLEAEFKSAFSPRGPKTAA